MTPLLTALAVISASIVLLEGAVRRSSPSHPLRPSTAIDTAATAAVNFFYSAGRYIASIVDITEVIRDVMLLWAAVWTLIVSPFHFMRGWAAYWGGRVFPNGG
jgi:hypothetical protein